MPQPNAGPGPTPGGTDVRTPGGVIAPPAARELVVAGAGLIALLLLFFGTPLLTGRILSPADLLLSSVPWAADLPPGSEPANGLLADYVLQFRPWRTYTAAALREGRIPLWDPHNLAGAPLLGNGISAVLYPINLPFLLLPEGPAVVLWAMTRLFIAGLLAYVFGRVVGLSVPAAGTTALAFTFSGFLVVWLLWPQVNAAAWLPALFLATEVLLRRPTSWRAVGLAAVVCVQFLGGHPETSLHTLSAVGLFALWRGWTGFAGDRDRRRLAHGLLAFAGGVLLGVAGAAIQLLPLAEYILESATFQQRSAGAAPLWSLPGPRLLETLSLVCPYCWGSQQRGDIRLGELVGLVNFNELSGGYVGLAALLLAGTGIALGARRGIDRFFLGLALLSFCVVYAVAPVYNLVHALPVFKVTFNERALLLWAFAMAVLAGRGLDLLLTGPEADVRRVARWAGWAALALAAAGLLVAGTLLWTLRTFGGQLAGASTALPGLLEAVSGLVAREATGRAGLLALSVLALTAVSRWRSRRPLAWLLPAVLVLDLFAFGRDYNPAIPAALDYPTHASIEFVRGRPGLFRVLALDGGFPSNTNLMYGIQEVRGYNALGTDAYNRFLAAASDPGWTSPHPLTWVFSSFESRLVDLLNVRYIMSARELTHPKLALAWQRGEVRLYENTTVLPRAFLVYETRVLPDRRALEDALRAPDFDPGTTALLEEGPRLTGPIDPDATVRVAAYEAERVVLDVRSRHAALLVLADAWFPGWLATVDGAPVPIFRTDLALRGVAVPAGLRRVVFEYSPSSFQLGVAVSAAALVIAVAVPLAARTRRSTRRPSR